MVTITFALSVITVSVASLVGFSLAVFSIYLVYVHRKYSHVPGPKRDNFFSGNVPLMRRHREKGKVMHELVEELRGLKYSKIFSFSQLLNDFQPKLFICILGRKRKK